MCRKLCFLPDYFRYKKYNIITGTINTYPLIERIRMSEIGNIFSLLLYLLKIPLETTP